MMHVKLSLEVDSQFWHCRSSSYHYRALSLNNQQLRTSYSKNLPLWSPAMYSRPNMSHVKMKPVLSVSDQVWHKRGFTATKDGYRLEISDIGNSGIIQPM